MVRPVYFVPYTISSSDVIPKASPALLIACPSFVLSAKATSSP